MKEESQDVIGDYQLLGVAAFMTVLSMSCPQACCCMSAT